MSAKTDFLKIVREAHSRFRYVSDETQWNKLEDWRVPVLDEHGNFYGDCDDFAIFVFVEGRKAGLTMRVVTLDVPTRAGWSGHAVAYCEDCNQVGDNMHYSPYSPSWIDARWKRMSGKNTLAPSKWYRARMV